MTSDPRIPRSPAEGPALKAEQKQALRKHLLAVRRGVDADTRAAWDRAIGAQLLAWWRTHELEALGVYWPLSGEPDLQAAYAELARLGVRLRLPVVVEKHAALQFAEWEIGEAMVKDQMGVAVPATLRMTAMPPALLVPCLGFNAGRFRLGYGGGFYDRTLDRTPRPQTLGVAYACQQADFDSDRHDVALDAIVTERTGVPA